MSVEFKSELYSDIKAFERKLRKKYNYNIRLTYSVLEKNGCFYTIDDLYNDFVNIIKENDPSLLEYFIRNNKSRKRSVLYWNHAFRSIAVEDYKFGPTELGRYLDVNHGTVIHSQKVTKELVSYKDRDFMKYYTLLKEQLNLNKEYVELTTEDSGE